MKKSIFAVVFLFSVSVLAFLGPREAAEGQVKKKPDKVPMPITGTPSGRVIPLPTTVPQFNKSSALDLHLFDDLKKPLGGSRFQDRRHFHLSGRFEPYGFFTEGAFRDAVHCPQDVPSAHV